jgi:DNA-binding response OmpR family regulator
MIILVGHDEAPELLTMVRRFRGVTEVPIVIIDNALQEDLHVQILEAGADLVRYRPYSSRLLISQLRALLRRAGGVPIFSLPTLSLGGLTLDPAARVVRVEDSEAKRLTQLEFRLLYTLMVHRGQILPADAIVEQVWGYAGEGNRDLVRGLVNRLRAKVEPDPRAPRYVETVPGVGYTFPIHDEG